jgi:hypothetical protein
MSRPLGTRFGDLVGKRDVLRVECRSVGASVASHSAD